MQNPIRVALAAILIMMAGLFAPTVSHAAGSNQTACYDTKVVHEARYKKTVEETKTQWHFVKYTRTKTLKYGERAWSDYSGWTKWTPITHESWENTNVPSLGEPAFHGEGKYSDGTKWYRQWQSRNTGETREVKTGSKTVYYLPGGDQSSTLGEANWTVDDVSSAWTLIDKRDREVKIEIPCPAKKVTRTFQVDTYTNPTGSLANKAAGYDNDGRLKFGEDKSHYGHSRYQIVKVTGTDQWTASQWRSGINKATTKAGVGNVNSGSHATAAQVNKGDKLTVAWEILPGSWRDSSGGSPQKWFARGLS